MLYILHAVGGTAGVDSPVSMVTAAALGLFSLLKEAANFVQKEGERKRREEGGKEGRREGGGSTQQMESFIPAE